jgi:hypothetical protein
MVLIGLAMGAAARWGLLLRDREAVTWRVVAIDMLVLGLLALAAKWTVGRLGMTGESTALVAALFALSSDRIVRLMLTWFLANAKRGMQVGGEADLAAQARARRSQPPVERDFDPVDRSPVTDDAPELGALLDKLDRP